MSIAIPAGGSFQNSSQPWLTPQVLVDINLETFEILAAPGFIPVPEDLAVIRYDRVINAEIQLIYIDESKISLQLEEVLTTITSALASDWNPSERQGIALLPNDAAVNSTNFQFGLQIDNTQEIRYISVWIQSKKLKIEYATQAFQKVKTYVLAALAA
ncbi:hypothetical protein [Nostoc sp.]|uniref:hypothetical protein n=1 Tax=Nostoc sp. TaxID=1180 RepID=UPI002FFB308A